MNKGPLLSIIVPAFNSEPFIAECIDSVYAALGNCSIELVAVDDGSSDNTAQVIESLKDKYPGIKLIKQANAGVSAARNRGLSEASGEWVAFVDADDRINPGCCASLAEVLASASQEMIVMRSFEGAEERYPWGGLFADRSTHAREELMEKGYLRGSICGCCFRRKFLQDNGILFPEGVRLGEDTLFFGHTISAAAGVLFADISFYCVSSRLDSASRRRRKEDVAYAAEAVKAAATISAAPVRNYTIFKLTIALTSRAAESRVRAAEARRMAGLDKLLPLSLEGIGRERLKIRLLNLSYPLFYALVGIRDRI